MKKCFLYSLLLMATMCFVSCGESPDSLSPSTAKKLFKDELKRRNQLDVYSSVQIGYFECNENDIRFKLRQLAANDLITYQCKQVPKKERIKKTRMVTKNSWYGTYQTKQTYWEDEDVTKYFVKTALTEKGQKLVYEEKDVKPSADEEELRKDFEVDKTKFPEAAVKEMEFPEKATPMEEQIETEETETKEDLAGSGEDEVENYVEVNDNTSEYDKEKAKESSQEVNLLAYTFSVMKARNILKTGDFSATAEIILEVNESTPVGRIINNIYKGQRTMVEDVKYTFYLDKGWALSNNE